jgi:hypothetical protein
LSTPADSPLQQGRRLPGPSAVIGVVLVVAFLVTIYGTFRWGWAWTGYRDEDNASLWGWLHLVLLPVTIALLPFWLRSRARRKAAWRIGFSVVALVFAVLVIGGYRRNWGWTGFKGNTLWNWLELLLVPFVLPAVIAWATTPPPVTTPEEQTVPDPAHHQRSRTTGPAADVLAAPPAENSAGHSTDVGVPVDRAEADAPDPAIHHRPAPSAAQRRDGPAAEIERAVAPAHSIFARLVQAHPAVAIATSFTIIGLLLIAALLPGRAPQPTTPPPQTATVLSRARWTDTGIHLTVGERVTITADGQMDHDGRGPSPPVGPDGDPRPSLSKFSVLPDAPHAALIGKITGSTEGRPFLVGSHYHTNRIDQSGLLLLGVNDRGLSNNTGEFSARIDLAAPAHQTK